MCSESCLSLAFFFFFSLPLAFKSPSKKMHIEMGRGQLIYLSKASCLELRSFITGSLAVDASGLVAYLT